MNSVAWTSFLTYFIIFLSNENRGLTRFLIALGPLNSILIVDPFSLENYYLNLLRTVWVRRDFFSDLNIIPVRIKISISILFVSPQIGSRECLSKCDHVSPYSFPSVLSNFILSAPWWRRQEGVLPWVLKTREGRLTWDFGNDRKVSLPSMHDMGTDRTQDGRRYFYDKIGVSGAFTSRYKSHLFWG